MASKPLTATQFPYTGPYGMTHAMKNRGPTPQALKRAMLRLGLLTPAEASNGDEYDFPLSRALAKWDPGKTGYGTGRWTKIRAARVPKGLPHAGELALDAYAISLVRQEANGLIAQLIYPHPAGSGSTVCQDVHPTAGIRGNYAIDFCAPGGTKIFAVMSGRIERLSGHDPASGEHDGPGIFGWSTYLRRPDGVLVFMTHQGRRFVYEQQAVQVGQIIGEVGHWPGDPGRSHTHLGVSSPRGAADAKKIVRAISTAPRIDL